MGPHSASPLDDAPFLFLEDDEPAAPSQRGASWKLLIADDDDEIHSISRMVLRDFVFEGRHIDFFSAHSGEEAKRLVADHPDAAVLLLDVVMETENAGLDVVRHVREALDNHFIRIILRTGQPGQAPEKSVIIDYDINDYKEKTELTAQKLVTTVVAALRAFRDIEIINNSRRGLEQIIKASCNLFEPQSLAQFSAGVLRQLTSLLNMGGDSLYLQSSGFAARCDGGSIGEFRMLAGTGQYGDHVGQPLANVVPEAVQKKLARAAAERRTLVEDQDYVGYFRTSSGTQNLVYLQIRQPLSRLDVDLLHVFSANVAVAFDNIYLNDEMSRTQAELINTLSDVVESRSKETSLHVYRVGESACLLAQLSGLPESECELLRMAAPMHDLGKIAIDDALLKKPGKLTDAERDTMQQHSRIGFSILKGSGRLPLRSAALIAHQHHEWWDGTGYPQGLKGEDIHIFGRIVGLIDVFDALSHDRCYKPRWPTAQILDYISKASGTQFDPALVAVFMANADKFVAIQASFPNGAATDSSLFDARPPSTLALAE